MPAVAQLDDLGLALLVCLVSEQHCIVRAPEHLMENVESRIRSLASEVFSLDYANVRCDVHTTGDHIMTAFERREHNAGRSDTPETKVCFCPWDQCIHCVLVYLFSKTSAKVSKSG